MARRPSKHLRPPRPLGTGHGSAAQKADGRWIMRSVPGARATKIYTCPECHRQIPTGVPHVVAWPADPGLSEQRAVDARRHFHAACWSRRP